MPYDYYGNYYPGDANPYDRPPSYQRGPSNMPPPQNENYSYQSKLGRYTQNQEPQQRPVLNGRLINDPKDILPKEIPMDGSISLFPKEDYSYILAKAWNSSGTIDTVKFVPDLPKQEEPKVEDKTQLILDKLTKMEETMAKLDKELNG